MRRYRQPHRDERGSIAILALWGVALVFVLLSAASIITRSEVAIARNQLGTARASTAAEAGTQLGLARLLRRRGEGITIFDGTPEAWWDGTTRIEIAIVDEAGKIDVNLAPLPLLTGLFAAVGRPDDEALLLACNVVDRRGEIGPGCPEPAESSGRAGRGRRFAAPEELAQLPGFDDALYEAIADYVTVATGASAIDPLVARRPVLLAIPGATASLVDAFLANRARWSDLAAAGAGINLPPAIPFVTASPNRDFTIEATATTADAARFRADLQVRLTDMPHHPYDVIAWRMPSAGQRAGGIAPPQRVP